jgi:hypothetical protein
MRGVPHVSEMTVITGHYGCGKTNLAVNLALDLAHAGAPVTLVDLDIVNPYFRSSDYTATLEAAGIRVISPTFAGTTLDTPSLPGAVYSAFEAGGAVIFDAGGDDVGATALGRFAENLENTAYDLLYVVNRYRNLTQTPEDAAALLGEIESASHLRATGVVNNSHLREQTTVDTVLDSLPFARQTAEQVGLPLRFTTVPQGLAEAFANLEGDTRGLENAYPIEIRVLAPWEEVLAPDREVK